jgi:hypothetical protein
MYGAMKWEARLTWDCDWALEALERVREAWRERPAQVRMWDG